VKATVPVGGEGLPVASVTVTVHVEGEPGAPNEVGEQATVVDVAWSTAARTSAPLLPACVTSPG